MNNEEFLRTWRDMVNDLSENNIHFNNNDDDESDTTVNKMIAIALYLSVNRPINPIAIKLSPDIVYTVHLN